MTYGAPRDVADIGPYLARVRGGKEPTAELVAEFVARYERIGWSPLIERTCAQAAALEAALGPEWQVRAGMRFSAPSISDVVGTLRATERIVGIVMSPQFSPLLMSGYGQALVASAGDQPVTMVGAWHREDGFVDALAALVREALDECAPDCPILFTVHSLPKRVFESEPGYVAQLRETAELVASSAGLDRERWHWAYQSAGHTQEEWLRPDLKEVFPKLAALGAREVLVVPVQFLADHLEVLYDLDMAAAEEARACGLRYRRIAMANTQPGFIRALAAIVRGVDASVTSAAP